MGMKFLPGMTNVLEVLNQMWDAFAAGPYGALPSTGGTLSGTLAIATGVGNAVVTLDGGAGVGTGCAITGYRNHEFQFAIGTESIVRGGTQNDLTFDSLNNAVKIYAGQSVGARPLAVLIDGEKMYVARDTVPRTDNTHSLGSAALAYNVVYARTGAINTSDARLKTDFRDLTAAEIGAARELARAVGLYRWRDAVDEKGQAAREHVGPTVQAAIQIMQAHDLDPFGYGFICHDSWERQVVEHAAVEARAAVPAIAAAPAVLDSLGNLVTAALPASPGYPAIEARAAYTELVLEAGDRYAFRYDELAMFIAAGQEATAVAIEARLAALEATP